jgi:hypothetical protein
LHNGVVVLHAVLLPQVSLCLSGSTVAHSIRLLPPSCTFQGQHMNARQNSRCPLSTLGHNQLPKALWMLHAPFTAGPRRPQHFLHACGGMRYEARCTLHIRVIGAFTTDLPAVCSSTTAAAVHTCNQYKVAHQSMRVLIPARYICSACHKQAILSSLDQSTRRRAQLRVELLTALHPFKA